MTEIPSGPVNRRLAEALNPLDRFAEIGRELRQQKGPPHPEIELRQQIEATKRRGLETGQEVKPRLLELRMRHRDLTGEDGG